MRLSAQNLPVQERVRWPATAVLTLGLAALLGAVACGRGGDDMAQGTVGPVAAPTVIGNPTPPAGCPPEPTDMAGHVIVENFLFCPATLTVTRGSEVRWTNRDQAPHTASADSAEFETGNFGVGESRSVRVDTPGTYTYFCRLHPFMRGTVVVTA